MPGIESSLLMPSMKNPWDNNWKRSMGRHCAFHDMVQMWITNNKIWFHQVAAANL